MHKWGKNTVSQNRVLYIFTTQLNRWPWFCKIRISVIQRQSPSYFIHEYSHLALDLPNPLTRMTPSANPVGLFLTIFRSFDLKPFFILLLLPLEILALFEICNKGDDFSIEFSNSHDPLVHSMTVSDQFTLGLALWCLLTHSYSLHSPQPACHALHTAFSGKNINK